MKKTIILAAFLLLAACGKPSELVFESEPRRQMREHPEQFKHLSGQDRALLAEYVDQFGGNLATASKPAPVIGRKIGEVLQEAKTWQEKEAAAAREAAALQARILAERKLISEKIAAAVTLTVTDKFVASEENEGAGSHDSLRFKYAVQNKSSRTIRAVHGTAEFFDAASGAKLGELTVEISKEIAPGQTIQTDSGRGWVADLQHDGPIGRIARQDYAAMKITFRAHLVAFDNNEVLRVPSKY